MSAAEPGTIRKVSGRSESPFSRRLPVPAQRRFSRHLPSEAAATAAVAISRGGARPALLECSAFSNSSWSVLFQHTGKGRPSELSERCLGRAGGLVPGGRGPRGGRGWGARDTDRVGKKGLGRCCGHSPCLKSLAEREMPFCSGCSGGYESSWGIAPLHTRLELVVERI